MHFLLRKYAAFWPSLISFSVVFGSASVVFGQVDSVTYLTGKFEPLGHPAFKEIPTSYASRAGMYLHSETLEAFKKMSDEAKKYGISLKVISATRNFNRQKQIWEAKWTGSNKVNGKDLGTVTDLAERAKTIMKYSAMPGTSRHHWGTDIDINSLSSDYFKSGQGKKESDWLENNAARFGFCRPYANRSQGRKGYEDEAWHWSYKPLAGPLLKSYKLLIGYEHITGFKGSDQAPVVKAIEDYVEGIDGCK